MNDEKILKQCAEAFNKIIETYIKGILYEAKVIYDEDVEGQLIGLFYGNTPEPAGYLEQRATQRETIAGPKPALEWVMTMYRLYPGSFYEPPGYDLEVVFHLDNPNPVMAALHAVFELLKDETDYMSLHFMNDEEQV